MANGDEKLSSFLDPYTPLIVIKDLNSTGNPLDAQIANYLEYYRPGVVFASAPPEPIASLGSTVRLIKRDRPEEKPAVPVRRDSVEWALDFLMEIFTELHAIICGTKKTPAPLSNKSHAALTALAAAIVHHLGVSDTTALGIAVLVLLSLGQASKKAFCKMTRPEELKELLGL